MERRLDRHSLEDHGLDRYSLDGEPASTATVWAVFGDLMAGLLGAFVLMLVCLMAVQLELGKR
jgi:hypothetical protein